MRAQITKDQLKNLLKQAQEAHHEYEEALEGKDEDWVGWYAEYIFSRLDEVSGAEGVDASTDTE
jgi:hypothetical protein